MLSTLAITLALSAPPSVNVHVQGDGFFTMVHNGRAVYAASAALTPVDGLLSDSSGAVVVPLVRVPREATDIEIDENGYVFATLPTFKAKVGRLALALFRPEHKRVPVGQFFVSPDRPRVGDPGENGAGTVQPGLLKTVMPPAIAPKVDRERVREWVSEPKTVRPTVETPLIPSGRAEIRVFREAATDRERITLGEIAQIEGDASLVSVLTGVEIADTPVLGKSRGIDRRQIEEALKTAGADVRALRIDVPRRSKISRKAQKLERSDVERVALEAAGRILGTEEGLKASFRNESGLAPVGELELVAESCVATNDGAIVIVVANVNGERFNSRVVKVTADRSVLARVERTQQSDWGVPLRF